ncbi:hypothetical protein KUTeg_010800 [Tegillarca granosa]|uniref:EF-hand domain-containing protein n=1 Tax=Tegillarca granosa TaxID=220873 RepID=A0ABQ9F7A7_TEGGR|nr:hypothetical protein KUTeg_010800 [Tegillarca granosa]
MFDHDGNGSVKHKEFIDGLRFLINADLAQKLKFLFNVYDIDGNGILDRKELKLMLISCMEESSLDFSKDTLDAMTDILFKSGDDDNVLNQMFKPPTFVKKKIEISRYCSKNYIKHNLRKVLFLVCYFLMNIGLGVYAAWNYKNSNGFIIVTRISGMNLNFNCMFVCVLMLRKCLTKLRETFVTKILPLDQCILFHKMVGFMIAFWSVVHTLAHIGNAIKWDSDDENLHLWEILFTTKSGIGWVGYSAILTGWALDIIVIIMIVCSLSFIREGGHFQVFYITHMLYIPFWILCIIHASNFWKWFIAPGVLFLGEKLLRSKIMVLARYGKTYIKEVSLFSSGVSLSIGCIWLHVRSAGNWTKRLYEYFQKYNCLIEVKQYEQKEKKSNSINITKKESKEEISETDRNQMRLFDRVIGYTETSKKVKVQCYIDGPYGTPTTGVFDTEHVVLIGAGIGVTPMVSILQSIVYRYKTSKQTYPKCTHAWSDDIPNGLMKLKKQLEMNHIEMNTSSSNDNHVIDMHIFMTAAQKKNDVRGLILQIALDLMYKKENKDLITGLKTKTEPGRPDWNKLFTKISEQKKGRVKVFFCGAPALGKTIKDCCGKFNFAFSKENF